MIPPITTSQDGFGSSKNTSSSHVPKPPWTSCEPKGAPSTKPIPPITVYVTARIDCSGTKSL